MSKNQIKIILGTNLWISFLITKNYSQLDEILFNKNAKLVFSLELLEEFISVAKRPKFRRFFSKNDIEEILETIQEYSDFIIIKSKIDLCRDSKDNFLLSLANDSNADYLLTGDSDLLALKTLNQTKILTIADFFKIEKL